MQYNKHHSSNSYSDLSKGASFFAASLLASLALKVSLPSHPYIPIWQELQIQEAFQKHSYLAPSRGDQNKNKVAIENDDGLNQIHRRARTVEEDNSRNRFHVPDTQLELYSNPSEIVQANRLSAELVESNKILSLEDELELLDSEFDKTSADNKKSDLLEGSSSDSSDSIDADRTKQQEIISNLRDSSIPDWSQVSEASDDWRALREELNNHYRNFRRSNYNIDKKIREENWTETVSQLRHKSWQDRMEALAEIYYEQMPEEVIAELPGKGRFALAPLQQSYKIEWSGGSNPNSKNYSSEITLVEIVDGQPGTGIVRTYDQNGQELVHYPVAVFHDENGRLQIDGTRAPVGGNMQNNWSPDSFRVNRDGSVDIIDDKMDWSSGNMDTYGVAMPPS